MKLFVNSANPDTIRRLTGYGIVDGITTNPSVIEKEGVDLRELILELTGIVDGPVNVQVTGRTAEKMVEQARELSSWAPNIVVKIPAVPEGFRAMAQLREYGVPLTATLVFTPSQALLAAKLGAKYVASFVKRQDAIASSGVEALQKVANIFRLYQFQTQILAAGPATHLEVVEAALVGVDVITMDPPIFEELMVHPMSNIGLDGFMADWERFVVEQRRSGVPQAKWLGLLG